MNKITLRDIANETGLSIVTVSKVINAKDSTAASKETIAQITETANRLGYVIRKKPDIVPKQKPIKIGVFTLTDHRTLYKHPFYRELFSVIKEHATKCNMQIQFFHDLPELESNSSVRANVYNGEVQNIIMLGDMNSTNQAEIKIFKSRFKNVVNIAPYFYSDNLNLSNDVVVIDTYYSTKTILNKLIKSGRRRILLLTGPMAENINRTDFETWRYDADGREIAYYEALKENGIPFDKELVYNCEWDSDNAYQILEHLITKKKVPIDAIFAGDDMIAIACMKVLRRQNIRVPEEIAVIGFNNQEFSRYSSPALSSVDIYYETVGAMAIELLRYRNSSDASVPLKVIVPSSFVQRKSCGL